MIHAPAELLYPLLPDECLFEQITLDLVVSLLIQKESYDTVFIVVNSFSKLVNFILCMIITGVTGLA